MSARPQAPFVAEREKEREKVSSLTCLNVYTFSSPRYFYETAGRVLRCAPDAAIFLRSVLRMTSSSIRLSIFSALRHRHLRLSFALAFYARTLRLCTFLICRYNSDSLVLCSSGNFAMRAHLRCTHAHGFLSFASRKHRGYYACMPGFDVAEGWGIFFFTWIPRGNALASLNAEHFAFLFKLYNSSMRFCGVFVTARRSEGVECTDFINVIIIECLKEFYPWE